MITIENLTLSIGDHRGPEEGSCLLEAASYLAGEPWSDHPSCVDPVIGALGRALNDGLFKAHLHLLVPYAGRIVNTMAPLAIRRQRSYLCADWAVRHVLPMLLDARGATERAAGLRALAPVTDVPTAKAAQRAAPAAALAAAEAAAEAAAAAAARWAAAAAAAARWAAAAEAGARWAAAPLGDALRTSALDLLDRMIALTPHAGLVVA